MGDLLLGAALALVASALLQLFVVPRVDARRRHEERWENDVITLGEVLTSDLPSHVDSAFHATVSYWAWKQAFEHLPDSEAETVSREIEESEKTVREALDSLGDAQTRIEWRVFRILSIADSPQLDAFKRCAAHHKSALRHILHFGNVSPALLADDAETEGDPLVSAYTRERRARTLLTSATRELASFDRPPQSSPRRAVDRFVEQRFGGWRQWWTGKSEDFDGG